MCHSYSKKASNIRLLQVNHDCKNFFKIHTYMYLQKVQTLLKDYCTLILYPSPFRISNLHSILCNV